MKVANNLTELIGNTPLVKLNNLTNHQVFAKLENFNPAGSIKDRPALNMIKDAENKGLINKNTVIIEPTSGNTGIGLAMVCAIKGYKLIITMPETMSIERQKLLTAYGAQVILTEGSQGMQGAIDKAIELNKKYPNSFMPQQFNNPSNPEIHITTTAQEIWNDTDGKVDILIAGVGTGGTISGTAEGLKQHNPKIKVIAVEPANSQVLAGKKPGPHKIQGIGANFIPKNFNKNIVDEIFAVNDDDAIKMTKQLATKEGILAGISSGAVVFAGIEIAKRIENSGKIIVVIIPDLGERYLSVM